LAAARKKHIALLNVAAVIKELQHATAGALAAQDSDLL
jgi:hypothetical protein